MRYEAEQARESSQRTEEIERRKWIEPDHKLAQIDENKDKTSDIERKKKEGGGSL